MSVYENKVVCLNCPPAPAPAVPNPIYGISYKLKERDIYGSSRIGIDEHQKEMLGAIFNPLIYERIVGDKQFEISNHLGNVLTVITDRKMPVDIGNDNNVDYFIPDIASANDYYAFGSQMPGRNFSSANYR